MYQRFSNISLNYEKVKGNIPRHISEVATRLNNGVQFQELKTEHSKPVFCFFNELIRFSNGFAQNAKRFVLNHLKTRLLSPYFERHLASKLQWGLEFRTSKFWAHSITKDLSGQILNGNKNKMAAISFSFRKVSTIEKPNKQNGGSLDLIIEIF